MIGAGACEGNRVERLVAGSVLNATDAVAGVVVVGNLSQARGVNPDVGKRAAVSHDGLSAGRGGDVVLLV